MTISSLVLDRNLFLGSDFLRQGLASQQSLAFYSTPSLPDNFQSQGVSEEFEGLIDCVVLSKRSLLKFTIHFVASISQQRA